ALLLFFTVLRNSCAAWSAKTGSICDMIDWKKSMKCAGRSRISMRSYGSASKGSNLSKVKAINLSVVLNHIRSRGPISRTELAEITDLTSATITNVVNQLVKLGLVSESGRVVSRGGGRYRVLLTLNEGYYHTVG